MLEQSRKFVLMNEINFKRRKGLKKEVLRVFILL